MPDHIKDILLKEDLSGTDLETLLSISNEMDMEAVFSRAAEVRKQFVGDGIYLRGLIEYSNLCRKDCFYCGIRKGNRKVYRYSISYEEVLACARIALEKGFGSVVIQSGERTDNGFINDISKLVEDIRKLSNDELGITLSCGEQSREAYQKWFDSGAHRYLLRFESSDQNLYHRIHPNDEIHSFETRISAIRDLKSVGYLTGSGMMIGLPGQTIKNIADDLQLLKQLEVDMVGLGPYIEHPDTPLYKEKKSLIDEQERLALSLKTIAVLRIYMKNINMASSTALDSLDSHGRERAIAAGANILMPNLTPITHRENYFLYDKKPWLTEADELLERIDNSELLNDYSIHYDCLGDPNT